MRWDIIPPTPPNTNKTTKSTELYGVHLEEISYDGAVWMPLNINRMKVILIPFFKAKLNTPILPYWLKNKTK